MSKDMSAAGVSLLARLIEALPLESQQHLMDAVPQVWSTRGAVLHLDVRPPNPESWIYGRGFGYRADAHPVVKIAGSSDEVLASIPTSVLNIGGLLYYPMETPRDENLATLRALEDAPFALTLWRVRKALQETQLSPEGVLRYSGISSPTIPPRPSSNFARALLVAMGRMPGNESSVDLKIHEAALPLQGAPKLKVVVRALSKIRQMDTRRRRELSDTLLLAAPMFKRDLPSFFDLSKVALRQNLDCRWARLRVEDLGSGSDDEELDKGFRSLAWGHKGRGLSSREWVRTASILQHVIRQEQLFDATVWELVASLAEPDWTVGDVAELARSL